MEARHAPYTENDSFKWQLTKGCALHKVRISPYECSRADFRDVLKKRAGLTEEEINMAEILYHFEFLNIALKNQTMPTREKWLTTVAAFIEKFNLLSLNQKLQVLAEIPFGTALRPEIKDCFDEFLNELKVAKYFVALKSLATPIDEQKPKLVLSEADSSYQKTVLILCEKLNEVLPSICAYAASSNKEPSNEQIDFVSKPLYFIFKRKSCVSNYIKKAAPQFNNKPS